jgi:P27 family predicted phage terminase small subunit
VPPRGPKPKPVEQALRDGTHPGRIPNPPLRTGTVPQVSLPDYFNSYQQTAWKELVQVLTALDVLDSADAATLETCAAMVGRMREARHELNHSDMVQVTQRGAEVPSPWWKVEKEAAQQVQRLLAELGLSPSARARLANAGLKSQKPDETLNDLLGLSGRAQAKEKAVFQ